MKIKLTQEQISEIVEKINKSFSREESEEVLINLKKEDLNQIAYQLKIPCNFSVKELKHRIIEFTVGAKIRSRIILNIKLIPF